MNHVSWRWILRCSRRVYYGLKSIFLINANHPLFGRILNGEWNQLNRISTNPISKYYRDFFCIRKYTGFNIFVDIYWKQRFAVVEPKHSFISVQARLNVNGNDYTRSIETKIKLFASKTIIRWDDFVVCLSLFCLFFFSFVCHRHVCISAYTLTAHNSNKS